MTVIGVDDLESHLLGELKLLERHYELMWRNGDLD